MLLDTIEKFKALAPLILPDLFANVKTQKTDVGDETATIVYVLSHSFDMEDVMDKFEDQMELTILYHFVPSLYTDFGHQCCAYSDTQFGHMFKIHAVTNGAGMVDCLTVTLYNSMDVMCTDLLDDLERHEGKGVFLHKMSKENLLVEFC